MTLVETLEKARDLIAQEGKWTQGWFARAANGDAVIAECDDAVCFCMAGAIKRVTDKNSMYIRALTTVQDAVGMNVGSFNDDPTRTQAEVVEAFDKAIALARET